MIHVKSARIILRLLLLLLPVIIFAPLTMPLWAEELQGPPRDFRFREPRVFVGGHFGINFPQAASDLFAMVTRELTLEKSDFQSLIGGFDVGVPFRSRYAVVFSFDYTRTSPHSESRDFVEENGDPITQVTHFSQMPITATLRFYPRKFGKTVGSYAWIPARILPYVAGGAGFVRYEFNQEGNFVERETLNIFWASLQSDGYAVTTHVAAGVDIGLTTRICANLEGRYSWAEADLSQDFIGFQPIDLDGLRAVGGIYFRF